MAARPAGAGLEKGRRHYGRNDRWLLGRSKVNKHEAGSTGAQPDAAEPSPSTVSRNDANEDQQRDTSLRGGASRRTRRGKKQTATSTQNDAGLHGAAMVCVTVRLAGLKSHGDRGLLGRGGRGARQTATIVRMTARWAEAKKVAGPRNERRGLASVGRRSGRFACAAYRFEWAV